MKLWAIAVTVIMAFSTAGAQQKTSSDQDERLFLLARTNTKAFAQELTKNQVSELGKVTAIVHWLVEHFDWKTTDYQKRTLQQIIERRGGNCDDFATVAIAAMRELAIQTRQVHDVHIRTESPERGERARAKVKEHGNLYSIFGRHHNDHIWLEAFDLRAQQWFPVDPWSGVVGLDEWMKARVWFGPRTSINPDASEMIVPIAIFAADHDGKFTINRTHHYLVDEFNLFYGGKLLELPAWKQWIRLLDTLDDKVKGAFAGTVNLQESEADIDAIAKVYEELRSTHESHSRSTKDSHSLDAMGRSLQVRTPKPEVLPTGMSITPTASPKSVFQALNPDLPDLPQYTVDHPVSTAVSPDGATLLILTSGYNLNHDAKNKPIPGQSNEYVFVYDITQKTPVKKQVLQVPNTFVGLAWNPNGEAFYVSGGADDDVHIFENKSGQWTEPTPAMALGHKEVQDKEAVIVVAGLAVNASGSRLLAANYENDSISLIDLKSRKKIAELDLRPGKINPQQSGVAGGEYPYGVAFKGDDRAYVTSVRDREIVVLDVHASPTVVARIKLKGQPNKLLLNKAQTLLFVAEDNSDLVSIITTKNDRVVASIKTTAPDSVFPKKGTFKGSNPNSLALSPDEHTLYVTNGGTNSVAVIRLDHDPDDSRVEGLLPTGWYPNAVSVSRDGSMLYVVNGKGNAGPNPKACYTSMTDRVTCWGANQYIMQLMKGGFLTLPRPSKEELAALTIQVGKNNHFPVHGPAPVDPVFGFLRKNIKHVVYIVKENRSYDQVLGDLEKGNGDPALTMLKEPITPNHHQLARQFVTLDNFFDSGEVSGTGWNWSTAARANDYVEKTLPLVYANRAFTYDYEGENRGINVASPTLAEREKLDPQIAKLPDPANELPGTFNVSAPDGPEDAVGAGYLWDSALRAKLVVRNYGFFTTGVSSDSALERDPAAKNVIVAAAANASLQALTDPYFRGFDQRLPDYWRVKEWEREFDGFVKNNNLPNLELIRLAHDHFGTFAASLDGVNTLETQMADNDYSLGLIVEKVAHSKYAADTLIFVIEDDAQAGPDHVDAHRSPAFVVGPYVKQGALISQRYNTVSLLRTIEEILGIKPLGLNDALQAPMAAVFSPTQKNWTYTTRIPQSLRSTKLPLPPATDANTAPNSSGAEFKPAHDAAYWEEQTKGFDFSAEDRIDSEQFNLVIWKGLMGDKPYPVERSGSDLRAHRRELLKRAASN